MSRDNLVILLIFLGLSLAYSVFLSSIINTGFANQKPSFDFWGAVGYWAGPGAIVVAVITFILTQRSDRQNRQREERERMCNSCNALLREIDDHKEAFTDYENESIKRDQDIHYNSRILVTDAYVSLLYSGLFTHFETKTQNYLSNLYLKIKIRNEAVNYMKTYSDTISLGDSLIRNSWEQRIRPYEVFLTSSQTEIMEYLEDIEVLIERQKRKSKCPVEN